MDQMELFLEERNSLCSCYGRSQLMNRLEYQILFLGRGKSHQVLFKAKAKGDCHLLQRTKGELDRKLCWKMLWLSISSSWATYW